MSISVFAWIAVIAALVAVLAASAVGPDRNLPRAKFLAENIVVISFGTLSLRCSYSVEWGDDVWHVEIEQVDDRSGISPSKEELAQLVVQALRGDARRVIFVDGTRVVVDSNWTATHRKNA